MRNLTVFMKAEMWKYCTSENYDFSDVAKFTTLIPSLLFISHKLSLPTVDLEISSLPIIAIKTPNKFFT